MSLLNKMLFSIPAFPALNMYKCKAVTFGFMDNFIRQIQIENFKSIESCYIENCKRINLFIGKPNAGKSNIIEALSLFSISFLKENTSKKLTSLVRAEHGTELFYNGNYKKAGLINTGVSSIKANFDAKRGLWVDYIIYLSTSVYTVDDNLNVKGGYYGSPIKRYTFNSEVKYTRSHAKYLVPPYGFNLIDIVESYQDLKNEIIALFDEYSLDIVFDIASRTIKIQQVKNGNDVFQVPYSSIAGTLQRLIFFKAAIASNDNSVLLFEEPEAHAFSPYMSMFTQDMINKKDNQFFIATYSSYILNDLLENAPEELSIYMVDYADKQTTVKQLTKAQMHDIYQYGADIFTNRKSFI